MNEIANTQEALAQAQPLPETRLHRDRDGWKAESEVELEHNRLLKLRTAKVTHNTGLRTTATVWSCSNGTLRHAMAFGGPEGDFSETVAFSKPARVTEAVVAAQHAAALKRLSEIMVAIERHYAAQVAHNAAATPA